MTSYYKIKGSDTIHTDRDCSYLDETKKDEIEVHKHRPHGELCDRCGKGRG